MAEKVKGFMKKHEPWTYGIGLFGIALLTGWMPDYTYTFFNDFAFKGTDIDPARITSVLSLVFFVAGIVGAVGELVVGVLVDRTKSKLGKVRPWYGYAVLPLAIVSLLVFIPPTTNNFTVACVWMFVIYSLYTAFSCMVESPTNCYGAVSSPLPSERSDAISIASIFRSVGQSGGMVVIIVVGAVMELLLGKQQFDIAEAQGLDLVISTAVCALGAVLFISIFFVNNEERIQSTSTKPVSIKESIKVVFSSKNLLMVALTKLTGFGRGVYSTVSLYIAVYLLGSKDLKIALLLPMGIGTAVSMLIVKQVLKKLSTKQTYIVFCIYGACSLAILYLVSRGIGFNDTLIIPSLIINFFVGLQHGNTNVTPNIMIADCVDEMEYKNGIRQEGLAYAGVGLFSKIAAALTKGFGPMLIVWAGYVASTQRNVAYAPQTDDTLNKFLIIYTIIPAVFVVLQFVPILFYDMVGEKKERITQALIERRGVLKDDDDNDTKEEA